MRIKLFLPVLVALSFATMQLRAQSTDNSKQIADKIAGRLNDSLHLNSTVRKQIYDINMLISSQKMTIWKTVSDSVLLQSNLQRIENTRDSLYKNVLPPDKYLLYIDRKPFLINGN